MWQISGWMIAGVLLAMVVFFARQEGKKSARLAAMKREIREQARVQQIKNDVDRMAISDVRRRLRR